MIDDGSRWFGLLVTAFVVLIPTAMGVALVVAAIRRWLRARHLVGVGQKAMAVVIENQQRSGSEGQLTFLPVVRFITTTGQEIRTVLDDLASNESHLTGTEYEIVYDPGNPKTAMRPARGTGSLIGAIIFALLLFAVAGFVLRVTAPFLLGEDPTSASYDLDFP
jgi:hypothetical protein